MKKRFTLMLWFIAAGVLAADNDGDLIKQGEYLARIGDCSACHTAKAGKPFAGGVPIATPIGTIYSSNITPDRSNGIGTYSYDDFQRAVRYGIAKNGDTLYPAMPYPSYAIVSDRDMRALYAWFMHGVTPVNQANRPSTIPWPLSMRWPLAIWRKVFAPDVQTQQAKQDEDPLLVRGRYLVEGLGHCGSCHTPRAFTLQEKALRNSDGSDFLSGSDTLVDGWRAGNLRGDNRDGLGRWSEQALAQFLRYGRNDRSAVFGGMTDVVQHSLQYLDNEDISAIARYLKSLKAKDPQQAAFKKDDAVANALWKGEDNKAGAAAYLDSCAACHKTDGSGYQRFYPALRGNPMVLAEDPTSLIHIVLSGSQLPGVNKAPSTITMPGFGWRLDDRQAAEVVNFIRTSWGNSTTQPVTAEQVAEVRKQDNVRHHQGSPHIEHLLQEK